MSWVVVLRSFGDGIEGIRVVVGVVGFDDGVFEV